MPQTGRLQWGTLTREMPHVPATDINGLSRLLLKYESVFTDTDCPCPGCFLSENKLLVFHPGINTLSGCVDQALKILEIICAHVSFKYGHDCVMGKRKECTESS